MVNLACLANVCSRREEGTGSNVRGHDKGRNHTTDGRWYGGGLSSMTMHHLHSVLSQILESAVKARKLARLPIADVQTRPKPKTKQIAVLDENDLVTVLDHLRDKGLRNAAASARCQS